MCVLQTARKPKENIQNFDFITVTKILDRIKEILHGD